MVKRFSTRPKILVHFETNSFAAKRIFEGVLRYEHLNGPWNFEMMIYSFLQPGDFDFCSIDGFIGTEQEGLADILVKEDIPSVFIDPSPKCLESLKGFKRYSIIETDGDATGQIGADYFLERNYDYFAYVNAADIGDKKYNRYWSERREEGFVRRLREMGKTCFVYRPADIDFHSEEEALKEWILSLPRPAAVMAAWDGRACQVIRACSDDQISIPKDIAVLGVDDDEILCRVCNPALSSIRMDNLNAGIKAGEFLDGMLNRKIRKPRVWRYGPLDISTRHSTNAVCYNDSLVNEAIKLIWDYNGCKFSIYDIAEALDVSIRNLEYRFKKVLGRTPKAEIDRIRLKHVCSLLREPGRSISEVSELSGFSNQVYLSQFFKKQMGISMTDFRKREAESESINL